MKPLKTFICDKLRSIKQSLGLFYIWLNINLQYYVGAMNILSLCEKFTRLSLLLLLFKNIGISKDA